jgi:hypothetical protein
MAIDEQDDPAGPPNPRRDDPRRPPVIDGTAQEISDPSENVEPSGAATASEESAESPGDAPRRSASSGRPLAAGALAVAIVALAASGGLWFRALKPTGQSETSDLSSQVAALRAQVQASQSLDQRVSALEGAVKLAAAAADAAGSEATQALAAGKAAESAAQSVASATERAAAAKAAASVAPANQAALVATLGKRIDALERRPDPSALADQLNGKLAALAQRMGSLDGAVSSLDKNVSSLDAGLAAQGNRLPPLEALLQAPKLDVPAVEANVSRAVDDSQSAALVVVARSLQQAVDEGAPFAEEVMAAQKLGADQALLKPLAAPAANGVATSAELSESFSRLAGPVLAGVEPAHRGGVLDRLAAEASSLVQIRTVGKLEGDSPAAVVARMESALAQGDVAAALKDRAALPASAQKITESWAARAQARADADQAARSLVSDAMTRLGKART